ncbi:MAG: hypothetical protein MJE68_11470 [Proteobacteria bacterium]|nr:hypothetical protein [Pseudomonadota bacterium]
MNRISRTTSTPTPSRRRRDAAENAPHDSAPLCCHGNTPTTLTRIPPTTDTRSDDLRCGRRAERNGWTRER